MAKRVGNRKASDHLQIAECGGVGLGRHSLSYAQESRGFVRKCGPGHLCKGLGSRVTSAYWYLLWHSTVRTLETAGR